MTSTPLPRRRALVAGAATLAAAGILGGPWPRPAHAAAATPDDPALFHDPGSPVLGNPRGSLPMAEFFDYRCPYCRMMYPRLRRLLAEDHDIRLIAKEWPIFGGPSVTAARVALAANLQGRYQPVHDALFSTTEALDEATIRALAQTAGVDMARLDHDLAARRADIDHILAQVSAQAHALGLGGTPGFVIGPYLVPGALSDADLRKVVSAARAKLRAG